MRAFIKREGNTIEVPEDFVSLVNITKDGYYHYKIRYYVDPVKAVRTNAFRTDIFVSKSPYVRKVLESFPYFNPEEMVSNLLLRRPLQKDFVREYKTEFITKLTSDITAFIPNNKLPSLRNEQTVSIKKVREVRPASVAELNAQNVAMPIMEMNRNTSATEERSTNGILRRKASNLLNLKGIDPASFVGQRTNTIVPAKHVFAGTVPSSQPAVDAGDEILLKSLLSRTNLVNQIQLADNAVMNVPLETDLTHVIVEETFKIKQGDLDLDEFYLVFRLKNNKDITLQTLSRVVNHSRQVAIYQTPTVPPSLLTPQRSAIGKNIINVKQQDPNGAYIRLYRKEFRKNEPNIDAEYKLVSEREAPFGSDYVRFVDQISSINPTIYRAIPVNAGGIMSAEFSSFVIETERGTVAKTDAASKNQYFVSIDSQIQTGRITIKVSDIPPEPIALELLRIDRTIRERTPTKIGSTTLLNEETSTAVSFVDNSIKENRIYEYYVNLIFKTGQVIQSSTNHIVEYCPIESNIVNITTTAPVIEENGADVDVKFTITKDVIQNDADVIKTFLSEQGFLGEFQDEIIASRERLGELFGVAVKRTNLSTGEVENFGVISSDEFSDQRFGRPKGVTNLKPGFAYKYTLTTFARNIETLMPDLVKTVTDNPNLVYTFKPSRWSHPITLRDGNMITDNSLKRNHSQTSFTFGTVVNILEIQVSLADILPSLYDGKAKQFTDNSVLVQWKVQGNVNKIDHFIVILDIMGMRTIVGKSHNVSNSNYFQFVDKLDNQESGGLTYFVVPVFYDYSRGPALKTNQVVI